MKYKRSFISKHYPPNIEPNPARSVATKMKKEEKMTTKNAKTMTYPTTTMHPYLYAGIPMDNPVRKRIIKAAGKQRKKQPFSFVIQECLKFLEITEAQLLTKTRRKNETERRQMVSWCAKACGISLLEISKYFGHVDHTSVRDYISRLEEKAAKDINLKNSVEVMLDLCQRDINSMI